MAATRRSELEETRDALAAQKAAGAAIQDELVAERQRREAAEARAVKALTALALLAPVKRDERGSVIALSGSLLFASGKSALLPAARSGLKQVANALQSGDPDAIYVVEGHTDSRGSSALNQELSLARANSVRDYLVERGITADRIKAEGHGSDRPVADNSTAEGRANNRRVEIVVKPGDLRLTDTACGDSRHRRTRNMSRLRPVPCSPLGFFRRIIYMRSTRTGS